MQPPEPIPEAVGLVVGHPSLGYEEEEDDVQHHHADHQVEEHVGHEELAAGDEHEVGERDEHEVVVRSDQAGPGRDVLSGRKGTRMASRHISTR